MKKNKLTIILFSLFLILLGLTIYTGIGVMAEEPEVVLKKTTLVYDENSGIEIENGDIIFNDKNQKVIYKLTLENTQDYDIKVSNITLSSPTEEFLKFETEENVDIIEANSIKEISLSLETIGIKGWGRNFKDSLIADISFEKWEKQEETIPPVKEDEKEETPKEDETTKEEVKPENSDSEQEGPNGEESSSNKNENIVEEEIENEVPNPNTSDKNIVIVLAIATVATGVLTIIVGGKKVQKYAVSVLVVVFGATITTVYADKLISIPLSINVSFESQNVMSAAYLTNSSNEKVFMDFWQYSDKIKNIYIQNEKTKIDSPRYSFDVTVDKSQRVKAYLVTNTDNSQYYDLYLQADGIIYLNEDASYYCYNMTDLEVIDNFSGVDASKVTDMSYMFYKTGYNSQKFMIDLSNFDASNATNMSYMFYQTGYNSKDFALNLSNFNASGTANMDHMFYQAGYNSQNFMLDFSNVNASKVTNMNSMFAQAGHNSKKLILNLSGVDISSVTNTSYMFNQTGGSSSNFALTISDLDTSNLTDMSYMFYETGYGSQNFTLDVSNFDTSNVTNMSHMFYNTGYGSPKFTLDVSNFDTRSVTNMSYMFYYTGYQSEKILLDLSNWDTSKVTNMSYMFQCAGYNSPNFSIDLSGIDTSNVTDMSYMFYCTAKNTPDFTLDVSNFNTSKVTNMRYMFYYTGYNSTKFNNISITIMNPNTTSYYDMFDGFVDKQGSKVEINYIKGTDMLTNKIKKSYSASNVVVGTCISCGDYIPIGTEIVIGTERFYVVSQSDSSISLLTKYNIGSNGKQNSTTEHTEFAPSGKNGWVYSPGPKEIDIFSWSSIPKTYTNKYLSHLKTELGDNSITGDLMSLADMKNLGCYINSTYEGYYYNDDYYYNYYCDDSPYKSWLITTYRWWLKSATSNYSSKVFRVDSYGYMVSVSYYLTAAGTRPVITIPKETLKKQGII